MKGAELQAAPADRWRRRWGDRAGLPEVTIGVDSRPLSRHRRSADGEVRDTAEPTCALRELARRLSSPRAGGAPL